MKLTRNLKKHLLPVCLVLAFALLLGLTLNLYKPLKWLTNKKAPVKGDLITIDGKPYRVLKVDGTVAEVLSLEIYRQSYLAFNPASASAKNVYAGSNVDKYCNETFYNEILSKDVRKAIVDKTFRQDAWFKDDSGSPVYVETYNVESEGMRIRKRSLATATLGETITRHCYALSVQDVIDYLEVTPSMTADNTTFTQENIWKAFFNTDASVDQYPWLRSANYTESSQVAHLNGQTGSVSYCETTSTNFTLAAFQIDLAKVKWTK